MPAVSSGGAPSAEVAFTNSGFQMPGRSSAESGSSLVEATDGGTIFRLRDVDHWHARRQAGSLPRPAASDPNLRNQSELKGEDMKKIVAALVFALVLATSSSHAHASASSTDSRRR
jgi:hypothetical protein